MKYILTGGSGFIGTHFTEVLNHSITCNIDVEPPKLPNNHVELSILDQDGMNGLELKKGVGEDYTLIHLAAVHFDFQKKFFETNVQGTKNVLEFVERNNIKKFVFFSSVAIYGNSENGKNEDSPKEPINHYGKSKLEAEVIIRDWHKNNKDCKVIIVRPAVVFGEYNFGNVFNLIQQIKSKLYAIIGNGKNIKSIAYAKNLVDSVLFALDNVEGNYFEYNYCDYPQMSTSKLSNLISGKLGYLKPMKIPFIFTKLISVPIDILEAILKRDLKFNSMRIRKFTESTFFKADKIRDLGFKTNYSIEGAVDNTLVWMEENDIKTLRENWYNKASKL